MAQVIRQVNNIKQISIETPKSQRGARVFGFPTSKEIASYIDDAVAGADKQRLMNMFFAGHVSSSFELFNAEDGE